MWATETVVYTLTPAVGSNNTYAGSCDVTVSDITWNITGNATMDPWRLGGKSISNTNRAIYSKTAIEDDNVTKVVVTNGAASSITVNSFKLDVYSTAALCAAGGTGDVSSVTGTFAANGTTTFTRPSGDDWTGRFYRFTYNVTVSGSSNKFVEFKKAEFYADNGVAPTKVATPSISPASCNFVGSKEVTISCTTEDATITYTTDDWINSTTYTIPFTVTETTTVKAKATKGDLDDSEIATATYTKVEALTTMDAIFAASETAGNYYVTLDNWVVSAVKGSNAYVTDGTKGFIVYKSGHGFNVGDVLSGTCELALTRYYGAAETTNLASTLDGLTVSKGGTITPQVVNIDDLSGVNTGAVITVNNVIYEYPYLVDGEKEIQPINKADYSASFTEGQKYNVTGVYIQNTNVKQIAPRSASDIVEAAATKYDITIDSNIENGTVITSADEAAEGVKVTITATPATHYNVGTITVTGNETGDPIAVTNNQFTMPAEAVTVSATFNENAKYTVTYKSLGSTIDSEDVYEGDKCANVPAVTNVPEGWTFVGWTTGTAAFTTTAPSAFNIATATITAATTLNALFTKTESSSTTGWYETDIANLTPTDVFVIVGDNGNTYALPNDNGTSSPTVVDVTIGDDKITSEVEDKLKWNISGDAENGYTFYPDGETNTWLYCINDNSGVRVGDGGDKSFKVIDNYLFNTGRSRYIGIYSSRDWRSYTSINTNIQGQTFAFYKYVSGTVYYTTGTFNVTISSVGYSTLCLPFDADIPNGVTAYYATGYNGESVTLNKVEGAIKAGEGVVLKGTAGTEYTFTAYAGDPVSAPETNYLKGVFSLTDYTAVDGYKAENPDYDFFALANVNNEATFCQVTGGKYRAFSAYLRLPVGGTSSSSISMRFGDATMIENLKVVEDNVIYDLTGRRVENATRGIYIVNGKKVMIK